MGVPMGIIEASEILGMPKLNNYKVDLFQIKFSRTIMPVNVQRHGHLPVGGHNVLLGPCSQGGGLQLSAFFIFCVLSHFPKFVIKWYEFNPLSKTINSKNEQKTVLLNMTGDLG